MKEVLTSRSDGASGSRADNESEKPAASSYATSHTAPHAIPVATPDDAYWLQRWPWIERFRRSLIFSLWLLGALMVATTSSHFVEQELLADLDGEALLLAQTLRTNLDQYDDLAQAIADLHTVEQVLRGDDSVVENLNRFLTQMNANLGMEYLYVLDDQGLIVGSSNEPLLKQYRQESLAFRPYFQQAIMADKGRYYAKGLAKGKRGYFFSAPVVRDGETLGVAVVKLSLEHTFEQLNQHRGGYLLVGYDGVIFAASNPAWQQHSLYPLPPAQQQAIRQSRRYGDIALTPVGKNKSSNVFDRHYIELRQHGVPRSYLMRRSQVREAGWHVLVVMPISALVQRTLAYVVYYSLLFGVLLLFWLYWLKRGEMQRHSENMNTELGRRVSHLTAELTQSNTELQELVDHYRNTQTELQQTQDQLVQTAKLAVLGELSAGMNHELNQPLLALQTYVDNSQRLLVKGRHEIVADNLGEIQHILTNMHSIVSRLKVFARRSPPHPRAVTLKEIIDGTLVIMRPLLKKSATEIKLQGENIDGVVWVEPVQIQQVLINLITNAVEAMSQAEVANPCVYIDIEQQQQHFVLHVRDQGPGIDEALKDKIFEPFYTTKQTGLGIGLALSRRIVETLSGRLTLDDNNKTGTTFVLQLPKIEPNAATTLNKPTPGKPND